MTALKLTMVSTLAFACDGFAESGKVARGKYLVMEVTRCGGGHTPKLAGAKLDDGKWLKDAVLDFQPMEPVKGWHKTSPALVKSLTTGPGPSGKPADPPMPVYKMTHGGAEAIVEY